MGVSLRLSEAVDKSTSLLSNSKPLLTGAAFSIPIGERRLNKTHEARSLNRSHGSPLYEVAGMPINPGIIQALLGQQQPTPGGLMGMVGGGQPQPQGLLQQLVMRGNDGAMPVDQVAYKPGPNTRYIVKNRVTGAVSYHDTANGAVRAMNNQDNAYGGYVTSRSPYQAIPLVDPRQGNE